MRDKRKTKQNYIKQEREKKQGTVEEDPLSRSQKRKVLGAKLPQPNQLMFENPKVSVDLNGPDDRLSTYILDYFAGFRDSRRPPVFSPIPKG